MAWRQQVRHGIAAVLLFAALPSVAQQPLTDNTVRVRELVVTGLPALSQSELRDLTGVNEGDDITPEELAAVQDTLHARTNRVQLYPFALLTSFSVDTLAAGRSVNIVAELDPGPDAVIISLDIEGPDRELKQQVRNLFATSEGQRLDVQQLRSDFTRAVRHMREQGYPYARIVAERVEPAFKTDTVAVRVSLDLQPGARARLSRIEFAGLERTTPATARRVARLPNDTFHPAEVAAVRRRLLRTEWFRTVNEGRVFRDRRGKYGVLFEVQEQPTSSVSGAVGYAADEQGLAGSLDATLANLFGSGRAFDLHWRRDSEQARAFSVAYLEPFLFGQPLSTRLHLEQEARDSFYVAVEFGAELIWQLEDEWAVSGSLNRRVISSDSLASEVSGVDYSLIAAGLAVEYDTRDRIVNPRSGTFARVGSERLFLSGDEVVTEPGVTLRDTPLGDLYRNTFNAELSLPIRGDWIGYGALHGSEVRSDNGSTPPFAEWLQLGGARTIRGFAERSLFAPRAGWGTVELRRLLGPSSRAFALADAAVLNVDGQTRWEWAYGTGVQVDTGIGLLTVAIAVPGGAGFSAAVVHATAAARF